MCIHSANNTLMIPLDIYVSLTKQTAYEGIKRVYIYLYVTCSCYVYRPLIILNNKVDEFEW